MRDAGEWKRKDGGKWCSNGRCCCVHNSEIAPLPICLANNNHTHEDKKIYTKLWDKKGDCIQQEKTFCACKITLSKYCSIHCFPVEYTQLNTNFLQCWLCPVSGHVSVHLLIFMMICTVRGNGKHFCYYISEPLPLKISWESSSPAGVFYEFRIVLSEVWGCRTIAAHQKLIVPGHWAVTGAKSNCMSYLPTNHESTHWRTKYVRTIFI